MIDTGQGKALGDLEYAPLCYVRGTVSITAGASAGTESIVANGLTHTVVVEMGTAIGTANTNTLTLQTNDSRMGTATLYSSGALTVAGTSVLIVERPLVNPINVVMTVSGTSATTNSVPYTIYYHK